MAKDQIQEMLDAAVHFGHKTQKWNPKMRSYIYGSKNGIHFIDLCKTKDALEKAQEFLKHVVSNGQTILLVSTKPQAAKLIMDAANEVHMP